MARESNHTKRKGAALVEFAIVVPVLFLFFFAAFEFCRAAMIRHTADNAVYEAARTGVVPGATAEEVQAKALLIMNSLGVVDVAVEVTPSVIVKETPEVTVRIEVPLATNSFVPVRYFPGSISRQLTMRREGAK